MEKPTDIRWQQRLHNYGAALTQLAEAVATAKSRPLSKLEQQGLIKGFEFTHDLAWNVMKDYFKFQGQTNITGSRDAIREAFRAELVANGDVWMEMINSRDQTPHTYNQATADDIC